MTGRLMSGRHRHEEAGLVADLVIGATFAVLFVGIVLAAVLTQALHHAPPVHPPGVGVVQSAAPRAAQLPPPLRQQATPPARVSTVVYTVLPGDNLTKIAAEFHLNGYQPLYAANRELIGADPDLIRPGQVLLVSFR